MSDAYGSGDYSLVPVEHDPFAVPKPGQVVPPADVGQAATRLPGQIASGAWNASGLGDIYRTMQQGGTWPEVAGAAVPAIMGAIQPEIGASERIVGATLKVGDKVFTAPNHVAAMDQAVQHFGLGGTDELIDMLGFGQHRQAEGFMTSTGRVVDRQEAAQIAQGAQQGTPSRPGSLKMEDIRPSITAYHGSPYDFSKFDLSKIGTGEGAQAYGHGLYFAGNEGTALTYKNAPRVTDMDWPVAGTDYTVPAWVARSAQTPQGLEEVRNNFLGRLKESQAEHAAGDWNAASRIYNQQRIVGALDAVKAGAQLQKPGKMYQVSIAADPEHFLDWDKPLSEQSEHVQSALQQASSSQGLNHTRAGDAQSLSNLVQGQAFLDKGYSGLDAPSRRVVLQRMVSMVNDPEIRQSVVGLVPVDVMNVLSGQKAATEGGLHNASVLFDKLSKMGGSSVSLGVDSASSSISAIANAAAKKFGVQGDIVGRPVKGLAALPAGQDHLGSDIYRALGGDENAANTLKSQGVSGIKYLDQGSRFTPQQLQTEIENAQQDLVSARQAGQSPDILKIHEDALAALQKRAAEGQTHNYVVFDQNLISIIKKYGIAGLIAGGAAHFSTTPVDHNPYASGMARGGRVGRKARVAAILQRHGIAA